MMFWKKKKEGEKFYIPPEKIEEFYALYDETFVHGNRAANFRLWLYIFNLFPDLDSNKSYHIYTGNLFHPYIQESGK